MWLYASRFNRAEFRAICRQPHDTRPLYLRQVSNDSTTHAGFACRVHYISGFYTPAAHSAGQLRSGGFYLGAFFFFISKDHHKYPLRLADDIQTFILNVGTLCSLWSNFFLRATIACEDRAQSPAKLNLTLLLLLLLLTADDNDEFGSVQSRRWMCQELQQPMTMCDRIYSDCMKSSQVLDSCAITAMYGAR
jgi:hypothetical protein